MDKVKDLLDEARTQLDVDVIVLYRRNVTGDYAPLYWDAQDDSPAPAYIASASELASFLRSLGPDSSEIQWDMFRDASVRRSITSFGVSHLAVAPLSGEFLGRYFLTAGYHGEKRPIASRLHEFSTRLGFELLKSVLRAKVRGSGLLPSGNECERSSSPMRSRLFSMARKGATFSELLSVAKAAFDSSVDFIMVEDADGCVLGMSCDGEQPELSKTWLSGLSRLPYLDRLAFGEQTVFVPQDNKNMKEGRLVCLLSDSEGFLGYLSIATHNSAELKQHVDDIETLRFTAMYLVRRDSASRTAILRKTLDGIENERMRVSIQLHDEASQDLVALKVQLANAMRAFRAGRAEKGLSTLEECARIADIVLNGVNNFSAELRSSELTYLGLQSAVESAARSQLTRAGISFEMIGNALAVRFDALQESMLLSGVVEAISNCARHSYASNVQIEFHDDGSWFSISISDDGCGFDSVSRPNGSGMKSMDNCATAIGGNFWVASEPGHGTVVRFSVPKRVLGEAVYE